MSEIRALPNVKDEQSESAVRVLKKALALAESGEMCGVAIAGVMRNGTAYIGTSKHNDRFLLIGALFSAAHDLAAGE